MKLELITAPASEPLSLSEAKAHLRVDFDNDDTLITSLIPAARAYLEDLSHRRFITQTWRQWLDAFPLVDIRPVATRQAARAGLELAYPPVASITSIQYTGSDGTLQTLDSSLYQLDRVDDPAFVYPAYGQSWPTARNQVNAVSVTFVCGVDPTAIDPRIKQAMKLLLAHWYEQREDTVTGQPNKIIERGVRSLMLQIWNGRLP